MNYNYTDFHYPSSSSPSPPQPLQQILALPSTTQPLPATDFLASGLAKKQRKKRSKLVPVEDIPCPSTSSSVSKRKYTKPDPAAPKITKPCSECGKTFWSWKALFGHMRCHPERHWRGINPPPNVKRLEMTVAVPAPPDGSESETGVEMTEEEHEVAACLLLLANDCHAVDIQTPEALHHDSAIVVGAEAGPSSSMALVIRHSCSICAKVFATGQALGGHMRCHWEKSDEPQLVSLATNHTTRRALDLNTPAPFDHDPSSSNSSGLRLDLRLGL